MSGNGTLRERVLEAIRAGKLPDGSPKRTWGGPGCGSCCAICGERLKPDGIEFELEFATGDDGRRQENYHVHLDCFSAWNSERRKLELTRGTATAIGLPGARGETRLAAHEREAPRNRGPS